MFKKRKAQGLSITTVIVAVLGLIILVVIVLMLTGKLGAFSAGVNEGESKGQSLINNIRGMFGGGSGGSSGSSASNPPLSIGTCGEECKQEYGESTVFTFKYGGESCQSGYKELSGGFSESDGNTRCCCV